MKRFLNVLLILAMALGAGLFFNAHAVESWTQVFYNDLASGASTKGAGVLQTGQVSALSAVASDTTLISLVTAPATGQTYIRGIWVEKSTTDTGSVTLTFGTTTTTPCDTGATTLTLSAATGQTLRFGYHPLGIRAPAAKIVCGSTDAATTAFRVLAQ
jgi:hypothetical protein